MHTFKSFVANKLSLQTSPNQHIPTLVPTYEQQEPPKQGQEPFYYIRYVEITTALVWNSAR